MPKHNFDEIVDRYNTDSLKFDFAKRYNKPEGLLSFWVADMDFKTPIEVIDALKKRSEHGIFGYTEGKEEYFNVLQAWFKKRFNYTIESRWNTITPGIVYAICTAIRAFTKVGESVLIQRPVYYPFSSSIIANDRKLVNNALVFDGEKYSIDFEDFEQKIIDNDVKLFILCNPHNPVGAVWSANDLKRLGEICLKHNVIIFSDEIHADFIHADNKHTMIAGINKEIGGITITATSPSKTFNLAGLQLSNIFIENESIRRKFRKEVAASGYSQPNTMGLVSAQASYEFGEQWLEDIKEYIYSNITKAISYIETNTPEIKVIRPQGTYLLWVNMRSLGLSEDELESLIIEKAGLWLDGGTMFGEEGLGFQRINTACPWSELEKGLKRLCDAVKSLR